MKRWWLAPMLLSASVAMAAPAPYVPRYYNDGYQVFVGAGNLSRARQVVENALHWRPDDAVWIRRLALVTGWQGDTEASLAAWRELAERDNSDEAWQRVLALAPLVYDNDLALRAYRRLLRLHPRDSQLVERISRQYELLGRPNEGIAFLDQWVQAHPSRAAFKALQRMAEGTGQDLRAAGYYRDYMRRYGPETRMAWQCADLLWLHGKRRQAYDGLKRDASDLPYSPVTTRRLAVMAMGLGDWQAALARYRTLTVQGDASASDGYQYLTLARYAAPDQVASILRRLWRDTGDSKFALSLLYALNDRGDTEAVGTFIKGLAPAALAQLNQDPAFLRLYANYLQGQGQPERARTVLLRALALAPDDRDTREAWLWLLIAQGDDSRLAANLVDWEPAMRRDRRDWDVLSAAHMALDQPEQALRYERALLKRAPRDWRRRWAFSQALLAAGREPQAWSLLHQLWRRPPPADRVAAADQPLYQEMRAALAARFGNGDARLRFQRRALARTSPAQRARRAEWLAQWALGQDAPALARLWYLREKRWSAAGLPAGSALALANLDSDTLKIAGLRERRAGELTAGERLQADQTLGRQRLAAAELAQQQHDAPALAAQNLEQESLLLPASHYLELDGEHRRLGPLDAGIWNLRQRTPFGERWDWVVDLERRRFTSNNSDLLAVNQSGNRFAVTLHRQSRLWDTEVEAGQRSIFGYARPDLRLSVGGQPLARWSWRWTGEWHAPSDETSELLLAGQRTGQTLQINWTPAQTWRNSFSVAHYGYRDLTGNDLGRGTLVNLQSTWRPWLSRFSPGLRMRQTSASFGNQRPLSADIDVMRGSGQNLAAVPRSYNETEVALLFGLPDVPIRPHRLQAWGELGVTRNTLSGTGFIGRLGAEGPLLGRDAWRLYLEKGINTGGANEDSYRLGLNYRFYY